MERLIQFGEKKLSPSSVICILCVHNEQKIIEEFFRHHRNIGEISFFVIDDRSTDSTSDILARQPDVTVFHPVGDAQFRVDKKKWFKELLDEYCTNCWSLCLDADEHLIYRDVESRNIHELIEQLKQEGVDNFPAVMLDMYADKPLSEHFYSGGRLEHAFPFFDDPSTYRVMCKKHSKLFYARGGMRYRLFAKAQKRLIEPGLPLHFNKRRNSLLIESKRKIDQIARIIRDPIFGKSGYRPNSLKVPFIFWRRGMTWDEHKMSEMKKQSKEMGALLHFKMAKGIGGIEYIADRGQHVNDSLYSKWILSSEHLREVNPYNPVSKRFVDSGTLYDDSGDNRVNGR